MIITLFTLVTYIVYGMEAEVGRNDQSESQELEDRALVSVGETDSVPVQRSVRSIATQLLICSPFLALFVSGCVTTFVDDCKWPVLQTSAVIIAGFFYAAVQSLGLQNGIGRYEMYTNVLVCASMWILTPVAMAFLITLSWKHHNREDISAALLKCAVTLSIFATAVVYTCWMSHLKFAATKLLILSFCSCFMTLFLVWLGFMAQSSAGVAPVIMLAALASLVTLVTVITNNSQMHNSQRNTIQQAIEHHINTDAKMDSSKIKAHVYKAAFFAFLQSPLAVLFFAGKD